MRTRSLGLAVFVLAVLFGSGCVKGVVGTEIGAPDADRTILIAVYSTDFKDRIAQGVADRFKDRAKVTRVSIRDLNAVDYARYDALVIIDQLMAWQVFNFDSSWFLGKIKEPEVRRKVLLYLTAGSPKPNYTFQGIDAMTGATAANREGEVIETLSGRIDALLKTP